MIDRFVEMFAIEGLNDAIIGTGRRGDGLEVLVYDAYKAERILSDSGLGNEVLDYFLEYINLENLEDQAPIFVYLDEELANDIAKDNRGRLRVVH